MSENNSEIGSNTVSFLKNPVLLLPVLYCYRPNSTFLASDVCCQATVQRVLCSKADDGQGVVVGVVLGSLCEATEFRYFRYPKFCDTSILQADLMVDELSCFIDL